MHGLSARMHDVLRKHACVPCAGALLLRLHALQMGDGSFDCFLELFLSINSDALGFIDLAQLHAHLACASHTAAARRPPPSRGAAAAPPRAVDEREPAAVLANLQQAGAAVTVL